MFSKIAVAIDPAHPEHSAQLLEKARGMLSEGGSIAAISVVEAPPSYVEAQLPADLLDQSRIRARDMVAETISDPGVELHVVYGSAAVAILEQSAEFGADLIIVASHKPGALDYLLGSTAARVVRHAPTAVLVLR